MNLTDVNGHSPLHIAARLGLEDGVKWLLRNGANIEARDIQSQTPLGNAVDAEQIGVVRLLTQRGANPSAVDGWGKMPLHDACRIGSLTTVIALLNATPTDQLVTYVNQPSGTGETPLSYACRSGEIAVARRLLEVGAYPNLASRGKSPNNKTIRPETYRLPSSAAGIQMLNLLASFGADLFGSKASGWNHLHIYAWLGRADLCRELFNISSNEAGLDETKVTVTVPLSPIGTSELDVNAKTRDGCTGKTRDGCTAIFLAARLGHACATRCLLAYGADASIECRLPPPFAGPYDGLSYTPLAAASCFGHTETVSCLIDSGVSPDQTSEELTPLYIAAQHGRVETALALIEAGANVEFTAPNGWSILYVAASYGKADVVEMLLKQGVREWPESGRMFQSLKTLYVDSGVPDESRRRITSLLYDYLGSSIRWKPKDLSPGPLSSS
jgi:cytohesin